MRKLLAAVVVAAVMLTGCVGRVYTVLSPKADVNGRIDGVLVYPPANLVAVFETTHVQDQNGQVSSDCQPIRSFEILNVPDYSRPYAVMYEPPLLGTVKFSVEMDKGVLTKVNSESTSAVKESLDVLKGIFDLKAAAAPAALGGPSRACNIGKKLVGQMKMGDIPIVKP